jgi:DNA-binding transcriptional LysR family regulator
MELRHLRYFVAVAEELHFGRAALRLHMSQPPLSQQIRSLEQELGVELLARTRRRVDLTEPGRQFLEEARELLARADRAVLRARSAARGEAGRITLGMVGSVAFGGDLPRLLRSYRRQCPGVAIQMVEMAAAEQVEALLRGRIEVGFLRPPADRTGLACLPFYREPLVAVLPAEHPLAGRRRIPLAALAGDDFVVVPRSRALGGRDLVMEACLGAGFTPRAAQEALELQSVIGFVAAGFGVSLAPRSVGKLSHEGVAFVALARPEPVVEIAAVYRPQGPQPVLERFLEVVRAVAKAR